LFLGNQKLQINKEPVTGEYVEINSETFYKISNFDKMTPFFMSIVSSSDHWMFISSNGGLTAGRKNPDNALFPYYTDDVIHTSHEITGSKTILQITTNNSTHLWEPFSACHINIYKIKRSIYKNIPGNKIKFVEENLDLGISFSYSWLTSEDYGFIKKSEINNNGDNPVSINVLDGIQNILPFGVYQQFQTELSTLLDGYKKNELIEEYGIGIYTLSSIPSDKAEPSESLKATSVWSSGIKVNKHLLSSRQLDQFRSGNELKNELDIKAARGAYFINSRISLDAGETKDWIIVSEINQDLTSVAKIENLISKNSDVKTIVENDIENGTEKLVKIIASADGLQLSSDRLGTSRHFSNVLFNTMRGGIFDDSYSISKTDFILFLESTNKRIRNKYQELLKSIDEKISYTDLKDIIQETRDTEFIKLSLEYLPLTFSRRHGDPSRPWNKFSIDIKNNKNEKILNYEGNWRDLFQNWEALALSFPEYLEAMITKFLNASTADGYNPYRVIREGFDWEAPEEDTPWSNIGYWGDHQIIYLLKLLELSREYNSSVLKSRISSDLYSYANVPYKLNSLADLIADPHNTIEFDYELHDQIVANESKNGTDERFLKNKNGSLLQVNLAEKLFVTLLSKLSNFIPGAGIWMNTQRPEWNDANNALVGHGVSMVTLYYIRRYVSFCINLFSDCETESISFSEEVSDLFNDIYHVLDQHQYILNKNFTDKSRKEILLGVGTAGEKYRNKVYGSGFSSIKNEVESIKIVEFLKLVNGYVDQTIKLNKRDDSLYHAYNLISFEGEEIKISHLYEMLEGQVAVLSSGFLSAGETIKLLEALRKSSLYREDQNSYILYPDRQLPRFIDKNTISEDDFKSSELLQKLIEIKNEDIIKKDILGNYHFNGEFRNAKILKTKLSELSGLEINSDFDEEVSKILKIYESLFNHKSFTGRSGTFYKYEGLGSIYWHMVSKLVLAVKETFFNAYLTNADQSEIEKLKDYFYKIKDGVGIYKSPEIYGAFPTDPYSHTPIFSGVQQPGMTGQVKEDIISRFGELGLLINKGSINILPALVNDKEFLSQAEEFTYYDVRGEKKTIELKIGELAFTYCQLPFIYRKENTNQLKIYKSDGNIISSDGLMINKTISQSIFKRNGEIEKVVVSIKI
jgi:hypothetical protein